MSRTKPLHLVLLAAFGAVAAWLLETVLAASGRAVLLPPVTLAIALVLIGAIVVIMALPVQGAKVDPIYATRVVMLAKASSLSGALLGGAGLGIAFYLLGRAVLPGVGSITMAFACAAGAILLLVAGLIAEHMCTIPPDDDPKNDGRPDPRGIS